MLKLHTFGLLNNSFQPTDEIRVTRTIWRHRGNLVAQAGSAVQRIQKALTEMNVQLHTVLSDLSGVSGMTILNAILNGERDPWVLAALAHSRVRASQSDIDKSLHGNWRKELLLVLRQELQLYQAYQDKITECDNELRTHLQSVGSKVDLQTQPLDARPQGQKGSPRECSEIRPTVGVVSDYWSRLVPGQRH